MYDWRRDIEDVYEVLDTDDMLEISYAIAEQIVIKDEIADPSDPDFDDIVAEEADFIGLYRISKYSHLYDLLCDWYDEIGEDMEEKIRGFYDDGDYIYFVTGCGYSIYSADLLGGSSNGRAESEFDSFVREH